MKKTILSLLLFTGIISANTLTVLPAYNNAILTTDEFTIQFLKHFKLKDLSTTKYTKEDIAADTRAICAKDNARQKIENGYYFYRLATNYNATQIALIEFRSCTDISKNKLYIVNNKNIVSSNNLIVFFGNLRQLDKVYVADKNDFNKLLNNICNTPRNKPLKDFIQNSNNNAVMFIYSDKNATAFTINYFNSCP